MLVKRKPKTLILSFWNANSMVHKKPQIEAFLHERNIDIFLVSETFLRPGHRFNVANYVTYRRDRQNGPGGGTAILIKATIDHHALEDLQLDQAEANGVAIKMSNGETLKIYSFYSPGARKLVPQDLTKVTDSRGPLIVAGDFNAKHPTWHSRTTNTNGRTLREHADQHLYEVFAPQHPTHFQAPHRPDVIDLAILKNVQQQIELEVTHDLDSDHNPVILTLGNNLAEDDVTQVKKTNWEKYVKFLDENPPNISIIHSTEDIEQAITNLNTAIISSITHSTQIATKPINNPNDIPRSLKDLIRRKRRAKKKAQITLSPEDNNIYNQLQQQVRRELAAHYDALWNNTLDTIEHDDKAF